MWLADQRRRETSALQSLRARTPTVFLLADS